MSMTLPLRLALAANYKLEAVSNSGSVQGQPRTTPRVMFKTYEFVAHSWFLICSQKIPFKRSFASTVRRGATFFSVRSRSSITTRQALSRGLCSRFHTMPTTYGLRTARSRKDVERTAFFARIPRSATRFSVRVPARGARWVAGGGRSRTA